MKNKAMIFVNGNLSDLNFAKKLIDKTTYLIGADGGADKIYELGYKPHAVIGDFDSLQNIPRKIKNLKAKKTGSEETSGGIIYRKFPTDKDYLDTELALDFAVEKGFGKITLINVQGNEIDHMLGTVFLLAKQKYVAKNLKIVQQNQEIFIVSGDVKLQGKPGQKISLLPLFGKVKVFSCSGLKYDLSEYKMAMQTNSGISNEFLEKEAKIIITTGKFLTVINI